VDRLLLLTSLEKRKELRDVEAIDMKAMLEEVLESLQPVLLAKRLELVQDVRGDVGIRGERALVRHAVINLLQNAIAFSPPKGPLRVSLSRTDNRVVLVVEDRGPGIPDYARARIFDRFYSLPRPDNGKKSSGLGLTFVRETAALHGGSVAVENRPEGGVRATLRLAAEPAEG
jgi:two-component system sensor histidine kinase CreC